MTTTDVTSATIPSTPMRSVGTTRELPWSLAQSRGGLALVESVVDEALVSVNNYISQRGLDITEPITVRLTIAIDAYCAPRDIA